MADSKLETIAKRIAAGKKLTSEQRDYLDAQGTTPKKRSKRTPKKRKTEREEKWIEPFLETLSVTANVALACRAAKVERRIPYRRREANEDFADDWDLALQNGVEIMEAEAQRRAVTGVDEPVYYKGKMIDTVKRYSDTLLIFLIKTHRGDPIRHEHSGPDGGAIIWTAEIE